jgi:hypothetical protein
MTTDVSRPTIVSGRNIDAQVERRLQGLRKTVRHGGTLCSNCYKKPPRKPGQGYCTDCHNAWNRAKSKAEREELKRLRALHGENSHG